MTTIQPEVLRHFLQVTKCYNKGGGKSHEAYELGMRLMVKRRILHSTGNIYCRKEIEENPQEPEQNIEGRGLNS